MSRYQSPGDLLWRSAKKRFQLLRVFFRAHGLRLSVLGAIVIIGTLATIGLLKAFSGPNRTISKVEVETDEAAMLYDYQSLVGFLKKDFESMNKLLVPWNRWRFFSYYKQRMPWIANMDLDIQDGSILIGIQGRLPVFYMTHAQNRFVFTNHMLIPVAGEPGVGTGMSAPNIILTGVAANTSGLQGLFYGIDEIKFVKQMQLIVNNMSGFGNFYYIPGAQKLIVTMSSGYELYFDLEKNIIAQLDKYQLLRAMTGDVSLKGYRKIDVGTMDDMAFLSK